MIQEMTDVGFGEKEARIYALLSQKGQLSAPKISKELNMERRTVYDVLNGLFKKGWISKKKIQGREIFSAIDASLIARETYNKYLSFKKIVPDLKKKREEKTEVNILYGKKAIETMVINALKEKGEILLMGRGGYLIEQLGESKYQYISKLEKLNWKMIQTHDYKIEEFKPKEIRFLAEGINLDTAFLTFSDKVYLFSKQKEILIIEISDKSFADTFKIYFELVWTMAAPKQTAF